MQLLPHIPDGVAVLLQKPMGETWADARAILEICRTKRLTAAVNFQLRFAPNMLMAWRLNESGALGKVDDMEVRVRVMTPWHLWDFLQKAPQIEIQYHSIHYMDLLRSWFGNPLSVLTKTSTSPEAAQLAPTRNMILMDYGDDKRVFIIMNHRHYFSAQSQESFVQWEGIEGAMRAQIGVNLDCPAARRRSHHEPLSQGGSGRLGTLNRGSEQQGTQTRGTRPLRYSCRSPI